MPRLDFFFLRFLSIFLLSTIRLRISPALNELIRRLIVIVFVIAEFVSGIRREGWRSLKLFTGNFRILFPLSAKNLSSPLNTPIRTLLSPFDKRIPLLFSDSSFYPRPRRPHRRLILLFLIEFRADTSFRYICTSESLNLFRRDF